jgi:chitinase
MDQFVSHWNIMAYDFAGNWSEYTAHQSNMFPSQKTPTATPFNAIEAIHYYTDNGVAASKLVLGMPLYGRAFCNTDGLGQPFQGVGPGSWEDGVWDYKALPRPGAAQQLDRSTNASYSYDNSSRTLVSYDTVQSARNKALYVLKQGLGGAMWWESSGDKSGNQSLVYNVSSPQSLFEFPHTI